LHPSLINSDRKQKTINEHHKKLKMLREKVYELEQTFEEKKKSRKLELNLHAQRDVLD